MFANSCQQLFMSIAFVFSSLTVISCDRIETEDEEDDQDGKSTALVCGQVDSAGLSADYIASLQTISPNQYLAKDAATPALLQSLAESAMSNGKNLCAPVAMSNSLMWLSANGYAQLIGSSQV